MPHHGEILRRARQSAELRSDEMGDLLERSADEVTRAEESRVVNPELLQQYALIFGLSVRDLLRGEAEGGSAALLFRSMTTAGAGLHALTQSDVHRVLGRFMQRVRDAAELQAALSITRIKPSEWPSTRSLPASSDKSAIIAQAERLALEIRNWLGLEEDEPIGSVISLVRERFGIDVVFVDIDTLTPLIDGASTLHPAPAILVNLVGGPQRWWRTRMTLMHEFCHLLFDREILGRSRRGEFLFFSPEHSARKAGRWRLVERFEDAEQRANAFAACFLAPSSGIRRIVGDDHKPRASHVAQVQDHYRVGRITALNRLQDVYALSDSQRQELDRLSQALLPRRVPPHPDGVADEDVGLYGPQLRALVNAALAQGVIDDIEARRILNLDLATPVAGQAPPRPRMRGVSDAAVLFAQRHAPELGATFAGRVRELPAGGFEIEICGMAADGQRSLGALRISDDLKVQNPGDWRESSFER